MVTLYMTTGQLKPHLPRKSQLSDEIVSSLQLQPICLRVDLVFFLALYFFL